MLFNFRLCPPPPPSSSPPTALRPREGTDVPISELTVLSWTTLGPGFQETHTGKILCQGLYFAQPNRAEESKGGQGQVQISPMEEPQIISLLATRSLFNLEIFSLAIFSLRFLNHLYNEGDAWATVILSKHVRWMGGWVARRTGQSLELFIHLIPVVGGSPGSLFCLRMNLSKRITICSDLSSSALGALASYPTPTPEK